MMLKLQWYDIDLQYRKGKEMHISDTLSRLYLPHQTSDIYDIEIQDNLNMISVSPSKYKEIQDLTQSELPILYTVIKDGRSETRKDTPFEVRQYWDSKDQLTILDGIINKGCRKVIPPSLRMDMPSLRMGMLKLIHKAHLGMTKGVEKSCSGQI